MTQHIAARHGLAWPRRDTRIRYYRQADHLGHGENPPGKQARVGMRRRPEDGGILEAQDLWGVVEVGGR
jgi:hypothetical protein